MDGNSLALLWSNSINFSAGILKNGLMRLPTSSREAPCHFLCNVALLCK